MERAYLEELEAMKKRLLVSMEDYMTGDRFDNRYDVSYTTTDISECNRILATYVGCLHQLGDNAAEDDLIDCVQNMVLQLNELHDSRPDLIEESEREPLLEYIEFAAKGAGLKNIEDDITKRWREW